MNRFSWILMGFMATTGCNSKRAVRVLELYNPSQQALTQKPVFISRDKLGEIPGKQFPALTKGNTTVPAQLEDADGDGNWDRLFFLADLPAGKRDTLQLAWTPERPRVSKTASVRFGVRQTRDSKVEPALSDTFYADQLPGVIGYQHYQTDGPTWENDKVGFRIYLDGRNSVDVFGKKQSGLTPANVGIGADGTTENNYSEMKEWGTDILAVGNSVGIGGISFLVGDSLARLGVTEQDSANNVDTTICRILSDGPLHSQLQFRYLGWKPLGRNYSLETTASIWPGMHAFKNSVRTSSLKGDETLVIGLVNSRTDQKVTEINAGNWVILYTHDKQTVNKDSYLGLALIVPKSFYLGTLLAPMAGKLSTTYLAKMKMENNRPLEYYAVAAWEGRDQRFGDPGFFRQYLLDLSEQLGAEIEVTVK